MVTIVKHGSSNSLLQKILQKMRNQASGKKLDAKKFCGSIKLKNDPLQIQRTLRDEWQ